MAAGLRRLSYTRSKTTAHNPKYSPRALDAEAARLAVLAALDIADRPIGDEEQLRRHSLVPCHCLQIRPADAQVGAGRVRSPAGGYFDQVVRPRSFGSVFMTCSMQPASCSGSIVNKTSTSGMICPNSGMRCGHACWHRNWRRTRQY